MYLKLQRLNLSQFLKSKTCGWWKLVSIQAFSFICETKSVSNYSFSLNVRTEEVARNQFSIMQKCLPISLWKTNKKLEIILTICAKSPTGLPAFFLLWETKSDALKLQAVFSIQQPIPQRNGPDYFGVQCIHIFSELTELCV